jgi:hypothetical protein
MQKKKIKYHVLPQKKVMLEKAYRNKECEKVDN